MKLLTATKPKEACEGHLPAWMDIHYHDADKLSCGMKAWCFCTAVSTVSGTINSTLLTEIPGVCADKKRTSAPFILWIRRNRQFCYPWATTWNDLWNQHFLLHCWFVILCVWQAQPLPGGPLTAFCFRWLASSVSTNKHLLNRNPNFPRGVHSKPNNGAHGRTLQGTGQPLSGSQGPNERGK